MDQKHKNPFEYEAASSMPSEVIADVYIEDNNFTRLLRSPRNVFLIGERGSGKSITLLYNSGQITIFKAQQANSKLAPLEFLGIYLESKDQLSHKREHDLINNEFHREVISEYLFVLSLTFEIAKTLQDISKFLDVEVSKTSSEKFQYRTGVELDPDWSFFEALSLFCDRESGNIQKLMNSKEANFYYERAFTFSSMVIPLLELARELTGLEKTHFNLMIDDAHEKDSDVQKLLNSIVAYRDRSLFSLKIAISDRDQYSFYTRHGGVILDGHDYITIDMEKPFQSSDSSFGKLAKDIVERRLKNTTAELFFPINESFKSGIAKSQEKVRKEAMDLYGVEQKKKISDYVYKKGRAGYFRDRPDKANLPPYSGWETIVNVSTGVIRNLLHPCYLMYDQVQSNLIEGEKIENIPPNVQSAVLKEMSDQKWESFVTYLESGIEECSNQQAKAIYNLFDLLGVLFRERLQRHKSEPRAIVFTISGLNEELEQILFPLLDIARKARLLYIRMGPAKDDGKREKYYVPNRLLWISRGLDIEGQHARVSLKALDLVAATTGKNFPFSEEDKDDKSEQGEFVLGG